MFRMTRVCRVLYRQHHPRTHTGTSMAGRWYSATQISPQSNTPTESALESYRAMLKSGHQDVWQQYKHVQPLAEKLKREDFSQLRAHLWKNNQQWDVDNRILQVLKDMKTLGHPWTILEYNEFFMVKLYQARYQDIVDTFYTELKQSGLKPTIGTFNMLLAAYIKLDQTDDAIQLIRNANEQWGLTPDVRDFYRSMHRGRPGDKAVLQKARDLIAEHGMTNVAKLNANLVHLFRAKQLRNIQFLYEREKQRSVDLSTYGVLIKGYLDLKKIKEATAVYDDACKAGLKPDPFICVSMLSIYAHQRDTAAAEAIVRATLEGGHAMDELMYNQLIRVYFKARNTAKAIEVFKVIERDPNVKVNDIILNSMINGLMINKEVEAAKVMYQQMIASDIKPDRVTFNTLLKGFHLKGDWSAALGVISDMYKYNCTPDAVTFTTVLDSIFAFKQPASSAEFIMTLHETGMHPNIYTFNAVIHLWIRSGRMDEAEKTLALLQAPPYKLQPTVHTYTNLIQGYAQKMDLNGAMRTFQSMVRANVKPDRASYHFIICAFLDYDKLDDAFTCLQRMRRENLNPTKDTWKIMLDACVRRKDWVKGKQVVQLLEADGFQITSDALQKSYTTIKAHVR